ncbi:metallophosphoesterase family protein [Sinisalibacter lacisalsi]|uniref:Calcineurin-like phosphoesterase domain-containing protein n=1 Tax=Sinisalibacter lacisalsi TaxID=1526570 RepID=A0ABQ1QLP9_9RHOB|nr:metallophosphoesterase family protein [Sinisalibacter lacisalsi]GGD34244.1 hypothetical protein GCM10011358_17880 [Sinisalibacter lacisalsi]
MRIADLGTLRGPVIAYGGTLANLAALGALLREAGRAGVPGDRLICTGDIVGIGGQPAECLAATRAYGHTVVAGNIERQLAAGAADSGSGYPPGSVARRIAAAWWRHTDRQVTAAQRDWMETLPDIAVFAHEGRRYAVVHGGGTAPARFLWPSTPAEVFAREIEAIAAAAGPVDAVIAGHAGLAFERDISGLRWINAGMIGLPPHDGRRGGRYLRLDADGARILRLEYDPAPAFAAMVAVGLTQGWDLALMTGRWPCTDMLPEALRRGC